MTGFLKYYMDKIIYVQTDERDVGRFMANDIIKKKSNKLYTCEMGLLIVWLIVT